MPVSGVHQFQQFAAIGEAVPDRRVPRILPRGSGKQESQDADAARLAGRLRAAAPLSARTGDRKRYRARIGRHSDHERMPAGARSVAARAGSGGRQGRGRRAGLSRVEESVSGSRRGTDRRFGGRGRHRSLLAAARARRGSEGAGGDAVVPESDRRDDFGGDPRGDLQDGARTPKRP